MNFFITSSGTEIGKTYVTCGLIEEALAKGLKVNALKPVVSGFSLNDSECDTLAILKALGQEISAKAVEDISLYRFYAPLSPHLAAAREGEAIDLDRLLNFCRPKPGMLNLVEGAGGVMAPITPKLTMLDFMQGLGFPVILVVGSYLGSISHSLTAASTLQQKGVKLALIVVSQSKIEPNPLEETLETLRNFLSNIPIAVVRRNQKPQILGKLGI